MNLRELIEQREEQTLSAHATRSSQSRGRLKPEPESCPPPRPIE